MLFFVFFFKQKTAYEMLRSLVGSEMCIRDRLLTDDRNSNPLAQTAYGWAINIQYRISLERHGQAYTCSVVGPGATQPIQISGNSNLVPRDGNAVDIWAYGATAQYGSVQIVGKP